MFIEERHQEILRIIKENGRISIGEIQEMFDVSVDSARRDLRILESQNLLKRTHGGAIQLTEENANISSKKRKTAPKKNETNKINKEISEDFANFEQIAVKAIDYISPGDIVYVPGNPFGFLILQHINEDVPFTLVTNSIPVADAAKQFPFVTVYIIGGKVRSKGGNIVDVFASEFVNNMHFDTSFLAGSSFSAEFGLSNVNSETVNFQKAVMRNSDKTIVLLPNQKLGLDNFIKVADTNEFDVIITDSGASEEIINSINEAGAEVVIA